MSLRIVFMGTPDFAVPSLKILVENGYNVVGVVTATDKLGGRGGQTLLQSAVKKYALEAGLRVLQPEKFRDGAFLEELRGLRADLQVVVAFRMLPEVVWRMPRIGTFNLHGSLLPKYRGAAPINWAVINGETETGLTTFFLQHEIDTGDVLFRDRLPIGPNETAGELHDRMMLAGADLVLKTVRAIEASDYVLQKQEDGAATHAPKIFDQTCEINFGQPADKVHNFIRGLSPYPGAWTMLEGLKFKIFRAELSEHPSKLSSGELSSDGKTFLEIGCSEGSIRILEVQLEGKKRMDLRTFLNGYKILLHKSVG